MSKLLLIRGARQLVTMRGPLGPRRGRALGEPAVIQDGAILVRDGIITDVGQGRRVENLTEARRAEPVDVTGRVVLPGFVDCHTYLLAGFVRPWEHAERRSAGVDNADEATKVGPADAARGIAETASRTLERLARGRLESFIRNGTTTVEVKAGAGGDRSSTLKALRVLARLAGSPLDIVATYLVWPPVTDAASAAARDYAEWVLAEMLPLIARLRLARFAGAGSGTGGFGLDEACRVLDVARQSGLGIKINLAEGAAPGFTQLGLSLGAVSVDHITHIDEQNLKLLAQWPAVAVLCPVSDLHNRNGHPVPARALVERGAAVALATGFDPVASPTSNMQTVVGLACLYLGLSPAEALAAATINGAHAAGCADRTGSIESGKVADLAIFDVADYRDIPCYFGENLVWMTLKRGRIIYKRGEVECPQD